MLGGGGLPNLTELDLRNNDGLTEVSQNMLKGLQLMRKKIKVRV
jgi:hypothetical protein